MAGFKDAMQQPTAAQEDGFGEAGEPATEEEQALLDAFLDLAADVIYPERGGVNPQVLNDLKGGFDPKVLPMFERVEPPLNPKDPKDAVAAASVLLLVTLDSQLGYQEKANQEARPGPQQPTPPMPEGPEMDEEGEEGDEEDEGEEEETPPSYSAVLWEAGQQIVGILADIAEASRIVDLSEDEMGYVWMRALDLYRYVSPNLDRKAMEDAFVELEMAAAQGKLPGGFAGAEDGAPQGGQQGGVLPGLPGGQPMQGA